MRISNHTRLPWEVRRYVITWAVLLLLRTLGTMSYLGFGERISWLVFYFYFVWCFYFYSKIFRKKTKNETKNFTKKSKKKLFGVFVFLIWLIRWNWCEDSCVRNFHSWYISQNHVRNKLIFIYFLLNYLICEFSIKLN